MNQCNQKNWLSGLRSALVSLFLLLVSQIWAQSIPDFELPSAICSGQEVVFTNTTSIADGDTLTYNWIFEDEEIGFSSLENPSYQWDTAGEFQVQLVIENQRGITRKITKWVKVNPKPTAAFTVTSRCKGVPTILEGNIYDSEIYGQVNYKWVLADTTHFEQDLRYTFHQTGSYTASLKVTSSANCSDSISEILEIKDAVLVDFEVIDACFGDSSVFTNLTKDPSKEYRWYFGDREVDSSYNAKHLYKEAKVYNVTLEVLESASTCSDGLTKQTVVNPLPDARFSYAASFTTVSFTGPADNDVYRWTFGDGNRSDVQSPVHTYEVWPFTYEVCLATRQGKCWSARCESPAIEFPLSIDGLDFPEVKVYPNPSNGQYTIDFQKATEVSDISLFSSSGKEIEVDSFQQLESGYTFDLSSYPAGPYYLRIEADGNIYRKILIKK